MLLVEEAKKASVERVITRKARQADEGKKRKKESAEEASEDIYKWVMNQIDERTAKQQVKLGRRII